MKLMIRDQKLKRQFALTGICIASFLGCIDLTVVNTVLPAISREFDITLSVTQWVTSVFMISLSAFMVFFGKLADIKGRRKILYWGLGIFGVSSLAVGLSSSILAVIFFRFLQGIGCAVLYTVSGAIISKMFPEDERSRAIGILLGVNGVGLAIGPIIGGVLTGIVDWRFVFYINIPFVIISYMLCFVSLEEQKGTSDSKVDVIGSLMLIVSLITLVASLSAPISHIVKVALFLISILSFFVFYAYERKRDEPIIDFHLFRNKHFSGALLSSFFLAFYYSSVLLVMPMLFAQVFNENDLSIGLYLIPATALFAISSPYVGRLSQRVSTQKLIRIGLILFIMAAALFMYVNTFDNINLFIIPLAIFGIGWSLILGPSTLIALASMPDEKASLAMGTSWTIHNVGGAFGIACSVFIIGQTSVHSSNFYQLMLYLFGFSFLILLIISLLFHFEKKKKV